MTMICLKLWNHKKLHTSQTCEYHLLRIEQLWNHTKLHTSQTRCCRYDYIWCFGTIKNYTPLKLKQMPAFPVLSLTTIKNYTPLKLLSMRYPCVVVLQPYKTTQLSNPNIICKKENPKEKVKEKKSQIIDSFSL